MSYYKDKRIWITGASSGIGRHLAEKLLASDARLVLTARREELLSELRENAPKPENSVVLPADLSELDSIPALCSNAWNAFNGIDILILNAGVSQRSLFRDTGFSTGERLFTINFFSHVRIIHELMPGFEKQGGAQIVGVTSLSALIPSPLRSYYSSAKHALQGFYGTLAAESYDSGIHVSIVVPGFIRTGISYSALKGDGEAFGRLDALQQKGADPARSADRILRKVAGRKRIIHVGYPLNARIARFLGRFFPGILFRILRNMREVKES